MSKVSLTYAGNVVVLIMFLAKLFGWDLDEGQITEVVSSVIILAGVLVTFYGRYRHGDVSWLGIKK